MQIYYLVLKFMHYELHNLHFMGTSLLVFHREEQAHKALRSVIQKFITLLRRCRNRHITCFGCLLAKSQVQQKRS